ncbi:hypothetical protein N431DRAFT_548690 [Stipitochalara longipes BDJ]|nr:hypothetical protein N431DRAFT_548690 [Stipitochalara longipes BDJ]
MSSPPIARALDADNEAISNLTQGTSSSTLPKEETLLPTKQNPPPNPHSKPCTLCNRPRDVLIRCQIDETKKWHFVCTGKCWQSVSGGSADGDRDHPLYRYGGMWKNKHDAVSAKIKGKAKEENKGIWNGTPGPHRRRGEKAKRKRMGKDSGMLGDMRVKDDDGGSDIEVSEVSDEDGVEELLDGFEREDEPENEGKRKEEVKGEEITSVQS